MSENDSLGDLWSGMVQEAESLEENRKVALPRQPVTRRVSLREKLAAAYLSGFLPALLAIWSGVLIASARCATISPGSADLAWGLLVTGLVLAYPLAALTSSIWSVGRHTPLRYLTLAFLGAGVGQVSMTLPYYWAATLLPRQLSLARITQRLFESFLSFQALALCVAVGMVLLLACTKLRRSLPWVELGRPASAARVGLAGVLVLSPLLLLGGLALAQGRIAPRAEWAYRAMLEEQPNPSKPYSDEWKGILDRLEAEDPQYFRPGSRTPSAWSRTTHQQAEKRAMEVLTGDASRGGWVQHEVMRALLRRPQDLAHPFDLAYAVMEHRLSDPLESQSSTVEAMVHAVLPSLANSSLSRSELDLQLEKLSALESRLKEPRAELEEQMLHSLRWSLDLRADDLPPPLKAFGLELPFGPERLLFEYRLRQIVYPWMELREKLDFGSPQRFERSLALELPQHRTVALEYDVDALEAAVNSANQRCDSLRVRPLFASARTLIALRQFKLERGAYPASLSELGEGLAVDPGVTSYKREGGRAALGREHELEGSWENKEVPRWTLP